MLYLLGLLLYLFICLLLLLLSLLLYLLVRLCLFLFGLFLYLLLCLSLLLGGLLLYSRLLLFVELIELGLVVLGRFGEAHGDEHGTVRAWAKTFAHQVVRLAYLRVGGHCSIVGLAEVERADGRCEDQEHADPQDQRRPRVGGDKGGPASPTVRPLIVV